MKYKSELEYDFMKSLIFSLLAIIITLSIAYYSIKTTNINGAKIIFVLQIIILIFLIISIIIFPKVYNKLRKKLKN